ncbi:ATP-dependent Clp protease proteolytic subunit [Aliifodinibius sp. S!AR15-10]|uniref:ATP-dependent Clp protease proteolytic subunit n=1 Tax=Aliifodinibius sp. S!AR15-10 TaxID=2950437 RepID=UPI00285ECFD8|nr:ATP-dependent Clp protease proteolytic subunit [Aliifodinibius sp. S!AR15-10]MDR8393764.1 ATP-dependent Clp protease proteolytic subunit [Aliifodinibius sp. S!AR15-10]
MDSNDKTPLQKTIADRLFKSRIIIINGQITQELVGEVTGQLLALSAESDEPITLFIHSQGGHVDSGHAIYDAIRFVDSRVRIVGNGWVASAGALIYVAVPKEDRYCLPNTRFLLHQPSGGVQGSGSDIAIEAEEIVKMRRRLNQILAEATGKPIEQIEEDTQRNFWLTAKEAKEYGLVGSIIQRISEVT